MIFWTLFTLFCMLVIYGLAKFAIKHFKEYKKNVIAYRLTLEAKKVHASKQFRHEGSGRLMGGKYREEMRNREKQAAQKSDDLGLEDMLMLFYFHQWFIPRDYSYRQFEKITGLKSMMESFQNETKVHRVDDSLEFYREQERREQENKNTSELMAGVAFVGGAAAAGLYLDNQEEEVIEQDFDRNYGNTGTSNYDNQNDSGWQRTEPEPTWNTPTSSWSDNSVSTSDWQSTSTGDY